MRNKILFVIFFAVLCCNRVYSQHKEYQFSHLNIKDGLSRNRVMCIYKDVRGFMWYGTIAGLNRYDGYKFKVFKHDDADSTSINNNKVLCIAEGPENKLWVQTSAGFNIYDPMKERFNRNAADYLRSINIPGALIAGVRKGKDGKFWFLHSSLGLFRYDPITKTTLHIAHNPNDTTSLYSNSLNTMSEDSEGNIWLINFSGIIEKIDSKSLRVTYRNYSLFKRYSYSNVIYHIYIDSQNDIWVYTEYSPIGLVYLNIKKNICLNFNKDNKTSRLKTDNITDVIQDDEGLIWAGSDHGGIHLIDKVNNFKIQYLTNRDDDDKSLGQNTVTCLYKDNNGIVWIGTYKKGVFYYHDKIIKFPLYKHLLTDPNSLSFNDVNSFVEDKNNNVWIGTNGGGLVHFNLKDNSFKTYKHNPANNSSLTNDVIVKLFIDHDNKLWIGTYYGGLDCFDGETFQHYRHNFSDPNSISDDRIWSIQEDSDNNIWIGTLENGVDILDRGRRIFRHITLGNPKEAPFRYIPSMILDRQNNMWLSTIYGIYIWKHSTGRFIHLAHKQNNPKSIVDNDVIGLHQDNRGWVWVSTHEGLSVLNSNTQVIRNFKKEDGLPDNSILDIEEDNAGNIWVSSSNGLSNIIVTSKPGIAPSFRFVNYDETDGLQGLDFNEHASCRLSNGRLIFGGANGFNLFNPADIHSNGIRSVPEFTDFQLFNKSLHAGEEMEGHAILENAITETKNITLKYNENVFSVEFAALNYFDHDKVKHQYKLEGFDKNWITADYKTPKASYTNLDPGNYTLKVRALNVYGFDDENKLNITILPPLWRTTIAYIIYICMIAGLLLYIRKRGILKLKMQFAVEQERLEAKRMHELDTMKIKFFTNVSHEFRTPLALIMAPVDKILKRVRDPDLQSQLLMMNRNAKRLLNLVNQLLDFKKVEVKELELQLKTGDIINFIKDIYSSFNEIAEKNRINYSFQSSISRLNSSFDHDKIERIMFNLLSNAFKFTPNNGDISVNIDNFYSNKDDRFLLNIKVTDTGIGISGDKKERIFERFFQSDLPPSMLNQGSGIGLSITKEFIKLHNGEIEVNSELNKGSCFIITLPLDIIDDEDTDAVMHNIFNKSKSINGTGAKEDALFDISLPPVQMLVSDKKNTILIVEDNEDFRYYIKDTLKDYYNIIEAIDGKDGWQKALTSHPDLILSDVSMPEMNGIELCKKLKSDSRTAHLPILLLTAVAEEEKQLEGLGMGATDYITKPFNFEILLSKIIAILAQQELMRKTFQKQIDVKTQEANELSSNEKFIIKAHQYVERNIANADLSVESLSSEMCLQRGSLYKKLFALTGKTPLEFIRDIQIKQAAQLLKASAFSISEVAYKVGFNNPKTFAKFFKERYGVLPSVYKDNCLKKMMSS